MDRLNSPTTLVRASLGHTAATSRARTADSPRSPHLGLSSASAKNKPRRRSSAKLAAASSSSITSPATAAAIDAIMPEVQARLLDAFCGWDAVCRALQRMRAESKPLAAAKEGVRAARENARRVSRKLTQAELRLELVVSRAGDKIESLESGFRAELERVQGQVVSTEAEMEQRVRQHAAQLEQLARRERELEENGDFQLRRVQELQQQLDQVELQLRQANTQLEHQHSQAKMHVNIASRLQTIELQSEIDSNRSREEHARDLQVRGHIIGRARNNM